MSEVSELQKEPVVLSETIKQLGDTETEVEVAKDIEIKVEENQGQNEEDAQVKAKDIEASKESLDELKCIEQEMAELKRGQPASIANENNVENKESKINATDTQANNEGEGDGDASYEKENTSLGRDDLIAMLKGDEEMHDKTVTSTTINEENITEDVTIEGEGSFQIMEVVDDLEADEEDAMNEANLSTITATPMPTIVAPVPQKLAITITGKNMSLTLEQQRAIAMEQIQDLRAKRNVRNKVVDVGAADTKEKKDVDKNINLIPVADGDWNKEEVIKRNPKKVNDKPVANKKPKLIVKQETQPITKAAGAMTPPALEVQNKGLEKPIITSVVLLNQTQNNIKIENGTEVKDKKKNNKAPTNTVPVPQATGFKRTRIVKRKIIWDPDAPETCISYAQLARVTPKAKPQPQTPKTVAKQQTIIKKEPAPSPTARKIGQVTIIKQEPKDATDLAVAAAQDEVKNEEIVVFRNENVTMKKITPSVAANSKVPMSPNEFEENLRITSPVKRRSHTPIANGSSANKKKKISEIDRLMGDEGAINMINSVESEMSKKKDVEENEKSQEASPKHNMRSRNAADKIVSKRDGTTAAQKTRTTAKQKRQQKPKASSTWEFLYQQQASDEAMIIRRRSNSSYSSNASLHRLSLDGNTPTTAKAPEKKPAAKATTARGKVAAAAANVGNSPSAAITKKSFEFAKPKNKGTDAAEPKVNRRGNKGGASTPTDATNDIQMSSSPTGNADDKKKELFISVAVHKIGKIWQLEFNTKSAKFTIEMMKQIVDALNRLKNETECSVVVISTKRANFCQGIDLSSLMVDNNEKRKVAALEIATAVKLYLKTLATFTKPIIAAVNGNVSGIGVTQLLLFDTVIAGDKSTYEASSYAKIGQVPEGYCIWNNQNNVSNNLVKKLMWYGEKLNAHDVHDLGLVYKIVPPNSVFEEAISLAKKAISSNSTMYTLMKQQSIDRFNLQIDAIFEKEINTITEQWSSIEMYEKLKKFKDTGLY